MTLLERVAACAPHAQEAVESLFDTHLSTIAVMPLSEYSRREKCLLPQYSRPLAVAGKDAIYCSDIIDGALQPYAIAYHELIHIAHLHASGAHDTGSFIDLLWNSRFRTDMHEGFAESLTERHMRDRGISYAIPPGLAEAVRYFETLTAENGLTTPQQMLFFVSSL